MQTLVLSLILEIGPASCIQKSFVEVMFTSIPLWIEPIWAVHTGTSGGPGRGVMVREFRSYGMKIIDLKVYLYVKDLYQS